MRMQMSFDDLCWKAPECDKVEEWSKEQPMPMHIKENVKHSDGHLYTDYYCSRCGAEVDSVANYCQKCGQMLDSEFDHRSKKEADRIFLETKTIEPTEEMKERLERRIQPKQVIKNNRGNICCPTCNHPVSYWTFGDKSNINYCPACGQKLKVK